MLWPVDGAGCQRGGQWDGKKARKPHTRLVLRILVKKQRKNGNEVVVEKVRDTTKKKKKRDNSWMTLGIEQECEVRFSL